MNKYSWAAAILLALLTSAPSHATNLFFMKDAPVANMDDEDRQILRETAKDALENKADGEMVDWENTNSGHFGKITVVDTHKDYDTVCRTVHFVNSAGDKIGQATFRACKADDDTWRLAPAKKK